MTDPKQDADADAEIQLETIAGTIRWEERYKPVLDLAEAVREKSFDDAEAERFAIAVDAICRQYKSFRKRGFSKGEAGDKLKHGVPERGVYRLADVLRVLHALGWKADYKRELANNQRDPKWHIGRVGG